MDIDNIKKGKYVIKYKIIKTKFTNEQRNKVSMNFIFIIISLVILYLIFKKIMYHSDDDTLFVLLMFIFGLIKYKIMNVKYLKYENVGEIIFYNEYLKIQKDKNEPIEIYYNDIKLINSEIGLNNGLFGQSPKARIAKDSLSLNINFIKKNGESYSFDIWQDMFLHSYERLNNNVLLPTLEKTIKYIFPEYKINNTRRKEYISEFE